jgi:hypothetical protein
MDDLDDAHEHNAVPAAQISEAGVLPVIAALKDLRRRPNARGNRGSSMLVTRSAQEMHLDMRNPCSQPQRHQRNILIPTF